MENPGQHVDVSTGRHGVEEGAGDDLAATLDPLVFEVRPCLGHTLWKVIDYSSDAGIGLYDRCNNMTLSASNIDDQILSSEIVGFERVAESCLARGHIRVEGLASFGFSPR